MKYAQVTRIRQFWTRKYCPIKRLAVSQLHLCQRRGAAVVFPEPKDATSLATKGIFVEANALLPRIQNEVRLPIPDTEALGYVSPIQSKGFSF